MPSVSAVRRQKKAAAARAANQNRSAAPVTKLERRVVRREPERPEQLETGLQYLERKGRIDLVQAKDGQTYGELYRISMIEGVASIRSCLAIPEVRGTGGAGPDALEAAGWIAESRRRLTAVRAALGFHAEMIAVLDLICGRDLKPRDIVTAQRDVEEVETTLRLALDLAGAHLRSCKNI